MDAPCGSAQSAPEAARLDRLAPFGLVLVVLFAIAILVLPGIRSGIWDPYELRSLELARRVAVGLFHADGLALEGVENALPSRGEVDRGELPFTSWRSFRVFGSTLASLLALGAWPSLAFSLLTSRSPRLVESQSRVLLCSRSRPCRSISRTPQPARYAVRMAGMAFSCSGLHARALRPRLADAASQLPAARRAWPGGWRALPRPLFGRGRARTRSRSRVVGTAPEPRGLARSLRRCARFRAPAARPHRSRRGWRVLAESAAAAGALLSMAGLRCLGFSHGAHLRRDREPARSRAISVECVLAGGLRAHAVAAMGGGCGLARAGGGLRLSAASW